MNLGQLQFTPIGLESYISSYGYWNNSKPKTNIQTSPYFFTNPFIYSSYYEIFEELLTDKQTSRVTYQNGTGFQKIFPEFGFMTDEFVNSLILDLKKDKKKKIIEVYLNPKKSKENKLKDKFKIVFREVENQMISTHLRFPRNVTYTNFDSRKVKHPDKNTYVEAVLNPTSL